MKVKVTKPQLEQQVRDEVNNIVVHRQHSLRCLPKLSVDTADVSYHTSLTCSHRQCMRLIISNFNVFDLFIPSVFDRTQTDLLTGKHSFISSVQAR